MEITKEFRFDSAHFLPNLPEGHKCGQLHGHTFTVVLHFRGPVPEETGWLRDFGEINEFFKPILDELDHRCLNEIEGLFNPTSENISMWIWNKAKPVFPDIFQVTVKETPSSSASYRGTDNG